MCFLNDPAVGHECQRNRRKWALISSRLDATDTLSLNGDGSVCACACACACAFACMSVRIYARVCVRDVFAIYDNNISPRLMMIIIKNY